MEEYLDIVDENGEPTGRTVPRRQAHAEGAPHRTAHVWLIRVRNGRDEVLLQKRSADKDSFPGCFDISSAGHVPAGCGVGESALRELAEELGLDVRADELIPCGVRQVSRDEIFHGAPFHDREYARIFALFCGREETEFRLQPEEVSAVRWMPLDACVDAVVHDRIPHCIYPEELELVRAGLARYRREHADGSTGKQMINDHI